MSRLLIWGFILTLGALHCAVPSLAAEEAKLNRAGPQVLNHRQVKSDDLNQPLAYPSEMAYDPVLDEVYVVTGVQGRRVVVYGPDFFPRHTIGAGRGLLTPQGVAVRDNGDVYVCQPSNKNNPRARISVLNSAFFVQREIFFDEIPEAEGLSPERLAISSDGLLYVICNTRGILVLDNDGSFLRWLKPKDMVFSSVLANEDEAQKEQERVEAERGVEVKVTEVEEETTEQDAYADIPEEFRPRSIERRGRRAPTKVESAVQINFVTIDGSGRIYALSFETGKVYVYDFDEEFLFSFGKKGGSPGEMSHPKGIAVDEEQEIIYVTDFMRHTVLVYDLEGEFLFETGGRGASPGWFNFPTAILINKRRQFIVTDLFNARYQVLELKYQEWRKKWGRDLYSEESPEGGDGDGTEVTSLEGKSIPEESASGSEQGVHTTEQIENESIEVIIMEDEVIFMEDELPEVPQSAGMEEGTTQETLPETSSDDSQKQSSPELKPERDIDSQVESDVFEVIMPPERLPHYPGVEANRGCTDLKAC